MLIELASNKDILIGKLGCISFRKAFYAYVGSAMNGFKARLAHHLRKEKKLHWHIDYLLNQSEIIDIILCPDEPSASCHSEGALRSPCHSDTASERSEEKGEESHCSGQAPRPKNLLFTPFRASAHQGKLRTECFLAQALAKDFQCIPGFGSSDCHCSSHLYFDANLDKLRTRIVAACKSIEALRQG